MADTSFEKKLAAFEDNVLSGHSTKKVDPKEQVKSESKRSVFQQVTPYILAVVSFILPLLFLPITFEYYEITKSTWMIFGTIILSSLWILTIVRNRKVELLKTSFDRILLVTSVTFILSTILSIHQQTSIWGYHSRMTGGLIMFFSLCVLFYMILNIVTTQKEVALNRTAIQGSLLILALFTVLKSLGLLNWLLEDLQGMWAFLASDTFTPVGNPNVLYIIFLVGLSLTVIPTRWNVWRGGQTLLLLTAVILVTPSGAHIVFATLCILLIMAVAIRQLFEKRQKISGIVLIAVTILASISMMTNVKERVVSNLKFKPYEEISIGVSFETIKNLFDSATLTEKVFGSGPDTYAFTFPIFKPIEHNEATNWGQNPTRATNELFDVLSTRGLFGLVVTILFSLWILRFSIMNMNSSDTTVPLAVSLVILVFSQLLISFTIIIWFIFFLLLALLLIEHILVHPRERNVLTLSLRISQKSVAEVTGKNNVVLVVGIIFICMLIVFGYVIGRNFASEYYYKKSLGATGNVQENLGLIEKSIGLHGGKDYFYYTRITLNLALLDEQREATGGVGEITSQDAIIVAVRQDLDSLLTLNKSDNVNWSFAALAYKSLYDVTDDTNYFEKALQSIDVAITLNQYKPDVHIVKGVLYQESSDPALKNVAGEQYAYGYSLKPSYILGILAYGNFLENEQQYDEAYNVYERSLVFFEEGTGEYKELTSRIRRIETIQSIEKIREANETTEQ